MAWFLNNLQIICKSFLMMTKDEAEGPLLTSLHTLKGIPLCYKPSKFSCLSPVPEILAPQHPSVPAHGLGPLSMGSTQSWGEADTKSVPFWDVAAADWH